MAQDNFDKKRWTVFIDERGQHKLISPNGEELTDLIITGVEDAAGEDTICDAMFLVNLVPTKDDALRNYDLVK
ncbi:hypothetical protein [Flagellimonas sp.]|uniref:hypothetical protein n=1 Tax=Flagellimonas sp. TaxID=2058762 RepID=UPI003F4A5C0C